MTEKKSFEKLKEKIAVKCEKMLDYIAERQADLFTVLWSNTSASESMSDNDLKDHEVDVLIHLTWMELLYKYL